MPSWSRRFGEERAIAILAEAKAAREDLYRFIAEEKIDCDFALTGRFSGAAAPARLRRPRPRGRDAEPKLGIEAYACRGASSAPCSGPISISAARCGWISAGCIRRSSMPACCGSRSRPARRCTARPPSQASAARATATRSRPRAARSGPATSSSAVNGYADAADRWLRRRLVPVRSRIIATAPLSPNLMGELMPRRMMCSETRKLHYYYRPSPDGRRILFGGRDGTIAGDPDWPTENLRQRARRHLSRCSTSTAITHSWFGHVAMNRDMIPRIFSRRGRALRGRLLRLGRRVGALGRREGGAADPRRCLRPLGAGFPPAAPPCRCSPARPGSCRRCSAGSRLQDRMARRTRSRAAAAIATSSRSTGRDIW